MRRPAVLMILLAFVLSCTDKAQDQLGLYEKLAFSREWDALAKETARKPHDYVSANYHHLAQAWRGCLVEELFEMPQNGPQGLLYMPHDHAADVRQAYVFHAMGNMAAAQNQAFNSLFEDDGSLRPDMLQMLAGIELMRGSYPVAKKYLDKLEGYRDHREWARAHRRFLWDDEAVLMDPELGRGRRDFLVEDAFVMESPMDDLLRILDANPLDDKAMQYALAYLLLSKDMETLSGFVDRFYGSPALLTLPVPVQEALAFYCGYNANVGGDSFCDDGWCRSHGVEEDVFRRFDAFQQASLKTGGKAPRAYADTFWNYLIYTKI